jgi:hypothetical protein
MTKQFRNKPVTHVCQTGSESFEADGVGTMAGTRDGESKRAGIVATIAIICIVGALYVPLILN